MTGTRALQLRVELIGHNAMEGFLRDCQGKRLAELARDVEVTGEAHGSRQAGLELREHGWREGLLAGRRSPPSL
jgi:hypothetical protein